MLKIKTIAPHRGSDDFGSGEFGASRDGGSRSHKGIDFCASPGSDLLSPVDGTITKLGYCYSDDLSYRYVQVTDTGENQHRFFYVQPFVSVGDQVKVNQVIGEVQDIAAKYNSSKKAMRNHFHYEIIADGLYVDPESFYG